jgi:hypothetical protein
MDGPYEGASATVNLSQGVRKPIIIKPKPRSLEQKKSLNNSFNPHKKSSAPFSCILYVYYGNGNVRECAYVIANL